MIKTFFCICFLYLFFTNFSNAYAEVNNILTENKCFIDKNNKKTCIGHPTKLKVDFSLDFNKRKILARSNLRFKMKTNSDNVFFFFEPNIKTIYLNKEKVNYFISKTPQEEDSILVIPVKKNKNEYELDLEYEVKNLTKWGFNWSPFFWKTDFSDSIDARFTNAFSISSFEEDRYPITYNFNLIGNKKNINVITSGKGLINNNNSLKIEFDSFTNSSSPYFEITTKHNYIVSFNYKGKYKEFPVTLYFKPTLAKENNLTNKELELKTIDIIKKSLKNFENTFGEYAFTKLVVNLYSLKSGDLPLKEEYSMEYGGAITSRFELIPHELCHQWFGRGASPKDGQAGFVDELICDWYDYDNPSKKTNNIRKPIRLVSSNIFTLRTKEESYQEGVFFSDISWLFKKENQDIYKTLRNFYQKYRLSSYSKEDFMKSLEDDYSGDLTLFFSKYIYGNNIDLK